jgi:hypothetical protein
MLLDYSSTVQRGTTRYSMIRKKSMDSSLTDPKLHSTCFSLY